MLNDMDSEENRQAQFRTVAVFVLPSGEFATTAGSIDGNITRQEFGDRGFGYDAIFRVEETGRTLGEMSDDEKNLISHRARAFQNLIPEILNLVRFKYKKNL